MHRSPLVRALLFIAAMLVVLALLVWGIGLQTLRERQVDRSCLYGLWLLYASGPMHLLLSVVLYAPGLLVFIYARRTHEHDKPLHRTEHVMIACLLIAAVPATWMLMG